MAQFSTHESVSLEKQVDLPAKLVLTDENELESVYEISKCADWIKSNNYKTVCLQFPDYLLPDSSNVALALQNILNQPVYILGDTAYGSCCIDYVAAAHIQADGIIHFGPTCFSETSGNIPSLNIYEKETLDVKKFEETYSTTFVENELVTILLDTPYIYLFDNINEKFSHHKNVNIQKIDSASIDLSHKNVIFVGNDKRKLMNLNHKAVDTVFFNFDPELLTITKYEEDTKIIKRRYFLIEKIKDSKTIGIVIGTLAVKNYLEIIDRIKRLITLRGKKYYLISVGKPTVAKLANLSEIDIYVMITCAMNEIFDSRDFFKPIVTPYDLEVALNTNTSMNFSYDYNEVLAKSGDITEINEDQGVDVSLITGNIRRNVQEESMDTEETIDSDCKQIALKTEGTVALSSNYGAGFLAERSWKGLDPDLGQTEVKMAEDGRKGIAQNYENENL